MDRKAQEKWEGWVAENPDLLLSVERGPDPAQTDLIARDIAKKLELGPNDSLLDVGCGSGYLLTRLRSLSGTKVTGVDFAFGQLALARRNFPDLPLANACAENLPFLDAQFTRLLCYGVFHYVENWQATVDDFLRVMKRPGIIMLGDLPSLGHKWRLYLQYFKRLPALLLHPRTFLGKLKYSQETSHWHWIDLKEVTRYLESRGCRVEILPQPRDHRQYGSVTHVYRFDLKIYAP